MKRKAKPIVATTTDPLGIVSTKCDEVIVQVVIRSYDRQNRPVREQVSQPVKVFRNAQTQDFWAEVDKAVRAIRDQGLDPITPDTAVE